MKDFVLYPEALALKELEFDEPCLYYYYGSKDLQSPIIKEGVPQWINHNDSIFSTCYSAPTYSQAFRWFREKYDLDIDISRNDQEMIDYVERKGEKYLPKYRYGYSNGTFISIGTCMKYEQAELACLQKLIELVKNKEK